jgi:2'-phosphotransferase
MARQHIHFAPALSLSQHPITPRPTSTLLIYLDIPKALAAGIKVYTSANGVILSPGDDNGVIRKEYWRLVERVQGGLEGTRTTVWRDGQDLALAT